MKNRAFYKRLLMIVNCAIGFALIVTFQACSRFGTGSHAESSGNGDGYGGMVSRFYAFDTANPCATTDAFGKPLPNAALFNDGQLKVVRQNCADQTPVIVGANQVTSDAAGNITYQGQSYQAQSPGSTITLTEAACPTGRPLIAGAPRTNLFSDSEELLTNNWYVHPGISRALSGSIAGIPLFSVTRSDPSQLDIWRRLTQFPNIFATKTYALSVVARAGSSPNLYVMMYQTNGFDVQVSVNVTTGAFTVVGQSGISGLQVQVQALDASTSFVTLFFTPTVNPSNPDIGFTSADTTVGSSVLITDVRLVNTADYCGP